MKDNVSPTRAAAGPVPPAGDEVTSLPSGVTPQSAFRTPPSAGALRRGLGWLLGLVAGAGLAWAQGTAFSYQGQLTDGAAAANGTYDLNFTLWNAATGGDQQGGTLTQAGVGVTNGLFTATLDFGAQFNGPNRWLEIAVRTNGAADFTTLAERQPVLPTPYAIHAATAGSAATATTATTVTGPIPATQLTGSLSAAQIPNLDASKITSGTFTGNGGGLTNIPINALVQSTSSVTAWGDNSSSQTNVPAGLNGVVSVAAARNHSLALLTDGTVIAWGANDLGQANVPAGLGKVSAVAAGDRFSLALRADGTVAAWGAGGFQQTEVPPDLNNVIAICAGESHSLALRADGSVVAWGARDFGATSVPAGLTDVVAVAAGTWFSLALKSDGTVVHWGLDAHGLRAGAGSLTDVIAIAARSVHCLALMSDGSVISWGNNHAGQTNVPAGLGPVVAIAAGDSHSLALQADGTVVGWGENSYGKATAPPGIAGVTALAAGRDHSLVVLRGEPVLAQPALLDRANDFAGAISAPSISGNGSGLTSLNASALTSGMVPTERIPDLDAGKVTTGTFTAAQIPNLDASKITGGTFTGNGSGLTALNASALASGIVPVDRIPDLPAGKITTGTLAAARIPNLDAGKITSGVLSPDRIPTLDASKISGGTFTGNGSGLTSLNASALSSGTVPVARIPDLDAAKITTGTLADARLSANVALENGGPAFTAAAGARVASFTGTRAGDFNAAVVHVENTQTGPTAAPALRVIGRGGDAEGALSVTANTGTIARFGNFTTWVAKLDNAGNFSATSFLSTSDRNKKAGFAPVDVEAVLAKVASLPLTTWHYTNDAAATPHLGPMAQDFHAAFGLGGDDKTITTVDADGVALAAIQGLNQKVEVLASENAELRARLERLEALLLSREGRGN